MATNGAPDPGAERPRQRRYRCLGLDLGPVRSRLEAALEALVRRIPSHTKVRLHATPEDPLVDLTVEFVGPAPPASDLAWLDDRFAALLSPALYGIGDAGLPARMVAASVRGGVTLSAAESCTGGRVCSFLTSVPGASRAFAGGAVTYANRAKVALLGVPEGDIETHGAVSEPVARAMAAGACARFATDYGIATTGIAGPTGGTPDKPVGTVWVGWAARGATGALCFRLGGGRTEIQRSAALWALKVLWDRLVADGIARLQLEPGTGAPSPQEDP